MDPSTANVRRNSRGMAMSIALICVTAGVTLLAARGQRVAVEGGAVSGANTPAAAALALVSLAGAGALLFLRANGRRAVGLLLVLAGAGIVAVMLAASDPNGSWFSYGAATGSQVPPEVRRSAWAWTGAGSGAVLMLTAAWVVVRAPRGSVQSSGSARQKSGEAAAAAHADSTWDRIDRGEDPTV